jgi:hypothetical protein
MRLRMKGYTAKVYVSAEWPGDCKRPVGADKIIGSWCATRKEAEREKDRLVNEHGGVGLIEC